MPNFTITTNITTEKGNILNATKEGKYEDVFNVRQECNNTSNFIDLVLGGSKSQGTLEDCKSLVVKNTGSVGAEIQIRSEEWTNATPDSNAGTDSYQLYLLGAGDYIVLPNFRQVNFQANGTSGADAYQLTNTAPLNAKKAVDNHAVGDPQLVAEAVDGSETEITVDDGSYFRVGDILQLETEAIEVTGISGEDLTVVRGVLGSSAATHSDDTPIFFAYFNMYESIATVTTSDLSGRFQCSNFFGYGRSAVEADGIVAGSFSGKFYSAGYQELGLSGITSSTATGLTASTAYALDIAADGGSDHTLSFTTDSNDLSFGKTIRLIQDALDVQFYTTSSNLLKKKVYVGIVGGDIRFTSGQYLSTSAIAISAPNSGTTPFGLGALNMAVGDIETAVPAKLPVDTILDNKSGISIPNKNAFFYDDGHGNVLGACTGTINYSTGALDLKNCPPKANFVVDANYGCSHAGGNNFTDSTSNSIVSVAGRSCNSKINTVIEVIGLK